MIRTLLTMCLLIQALNLSAQPLTKQEIASELGSKPSYEKQEVVDVVYDITQLYEKKMAELEARLVDENDARFEEWKKAYAAAVEKLNADMAVLGTENAVHWVADGLIGVGLIVYGIVRGDPAVIATGGLLSGATVLRLVIYLN